MEFFCVGESAFCELFSYAGASYNICTDADEAVRFINERISVSKDEIILVSERLTCRQNPMMEKLLNESSRMIVPVPSPSHTENSTDTRSTLRRLLGGV
jgi:vacuolar-type H+-ATPase subunit F/Vma7